MTVGELLAKIKRRLEEHYGDRLREVVLYGSEARGESAPDSDIDILCVLDGPVNDWREISAITEITYALQLEYLDRVFHIFPVSVVDYNRRIPLYMEARAEGVAI